MAQIQWYPGHMHKASKEMREALSGIDLVIELLDSRIPFSSQNPMLGEMRGARPVIRVLTRCDISDPEHTLAWQEWFRQNHDQPAIAHSMGNRQTVETLIRHCRERKSKTREAVTAMVVGIPNVGKSTLINLITGRAIAKTGNEPAITKMQQRIQLETGVSLVDTPGVLWPNVENPASGFRLAATGAIRETAITQQDVAWFLAGYLLERYPGLLEKRYRYVVENTDPQPLLAHIGRTRGGLRKGGKVDMDRASRVLLNDYRENALGRITLETPEMMQAELAEVDQVREQKAKRKAERKEAFRKARR